MGPRTLAFGLAALVAALDWITKLWIETNVDVWANIPVIPGFFDIIHTENRGMVFGLLNDSTSPLRTGALVVVGVGVLVFVVVLVWRLPKSLPGAQRLTSVALGLVLGGAMGNLYDRVVQGSVTDFLRFYVGQYEWPAFNVADSAITVGAVLMAIELIRMPQGNDEAASSASPKRTSR